MIELLGQTNEMLTDMLWMQCNDGAGHKTTVRTGLPNATWRLLNYGVQKSKSTTAQGPRLDRHARSYSDIDKALADLNGNTAEFRMGEDMAFIEAMNQGMQGSVIYGNTAVNPERFTGLGPRFSAIASANNGVNIVDAGGTGSNQQFGLADRLGPEHLPRHLPEGSKAGLQVRDLGEVPLYDTNNNVFQGYRTHFKWDCGLTVRDWRFVVRIANINVTAGAVTTDQPGELPDRGGQQAAVHLRRRQQPAAGCTKPGQVNTVFYVNRTVRAALDQAGDGQDEQLPDHRDAGQQALHRVPRHPDPHLRPAHQQRGGIV